MDHKKYTFLHSLESLIENLYNGRVHFLKKYTGKTVTLDNGIKCIIFRHLIVDPPENPELSASVFRVRFKFATLPPFINKRLSLFPAPFLIAKPGFRQKIWTISEDGYFQGIYQWASQAFAEAYLHSFIYKIMTKRAASATLSYEIIPDTSLSEYIDLACGPHH